MAEIRTMKIIVGAMTALMIALFIAVLYGLAYPPKRSTPSLQSAAAASATTAATPWEKALPKGAHPLFATAGDKNFTVLADTPEGRRVYIFDVKTGEIQGTLTTQR